jgi:hypothetical protein
MFFDRKSQIFSIWGDWAEGILLPLIHLLTKELSTLMAFDN